MHWDMALVWWFDQNQEQVIAYESRALSQAEQNYSTTDKEFLAIVWAVTRKFSHYLRGASFQVQTDHSPLVGIWKSCESAVGRRARWIEALMGYNMQLIYKPGRVNQDTDALSRMYCPPRNPPKKEWLDKDPERTNRPWRRNSQNE